MKRKLLSLISLSLLALLPAVFMPTAANAQDGTNQRPQLIIKIRNIDQLLQDIEKLMPIIQGSQTAPPTSMIRGMLQGTDWIDPKRSIVAGLVPKDGKPKAIILIPFRTANPMFQQIAGAIAGDDYYLASFPPEPGFSASPSIKESLISASTTAAAGSLVIEAAVSQLLDAAEPQMAAAMKQMQTVPQPQKGQFALSPQDSLEALSGMLKIVKQANVVRYGLDLSGDLFTVLFDIDALPNTPLSAALMDKGGDSRLMGYRVDMPIQFRSRSHNMAGMIDLLETSLGSFYRKLGIDFGEMSELVKNFTGEVAGGMRISQDGLALEIVYILRPGINGENFISNTYMPWLENYGSQISKLAAQQTGKPPAKLFERTVDSTVAGIKVVGIKVNSAATIPPEMRQANSFFNKPIEMRMAAADDMMFIASTDTELEGLVKGSRSLKKSAAQGPMIQADLDLGALLKNIQSLLPSGGTPVVLPDNLGKFTVNAEIGNGNLATRMSISIEDLRKLAATLQSLSSKKAAAPTATN
jgi:hypothetical protein